MAAHRYRTPHAPGTLHPKFDELLQDRTKLGPEVDEVDCVSASATVTVYLHS
jgi:hypothetical protein